MAKLVDMTGQVIGKLTVLEKHEGHKNGAHWLCQCECGNTRIVRGSELRAGHVTHCGQCEEKKTRLIDLTGQKFGRLLVLSRADSQTKDVKWTCQCDCGNITIVAGKHLKDGSTVSCGCRLQELKATFGQRCPGKMKDIAGQTFGYLTAIEATNKRGADESVIWKCKCKCGKEILVNGSNLRSGHTKSCGCLLSAGEEKIAQLLSDANIPYERQKTFDGFTTIKNQPYRFDFWVNDSYIIEFDGIQHFEISNSNWNDQTVYINTVKNDKIKNEYCFNNNIPLIRIPYYHYQHLTILDLKLETTSFIYTQEEEKEDKRYAIQQT